jgi:hypothetical protein
LLVRELDERLGLSAIIAENIMDDRRGKNTQLPLPDLLRQSIYSRLAGWADFVSHPLGRCLRGVNCALKAA